jgi:hemerythrin
MMGQLIWKDANNIGDVEIDFQHQKLFRLIDRLEDAGLNDALTKSVFLELEDYVAEHFHDEEEKLKACCYDKLEAHLRQHAEFKEWLAMIHENFERNGQANFHNIHDFLRDWLLGHILGADQAYKPWLTH